MSDYADYELLNKMKHILKIKFTKMSAGGNDFIIIDHQQGNITFAIEEFARQACRRKFSIGADGLLLLESSPLSANVKLRIFNSDGSEAEMCGNGACCTALYITHNAFHATRECITIDAKAGILEAVVTDENKVKLKMTTPKDLRLDLKAELGGAKHELYFVNTGVPHVVIFVEDLKSIPVDEWGKKIRYLKDFSPHGANVDFVKIKSDESLDLRVYERGVEKETFSCGTGAVAAAVIATKTDRVKKSPISIYPYGGHCLKVHLYFREEKITDAYLGSEAQISYTGEIKWQG